MRFGSRVLRRPIVRAERVGVGVLESLAIPEPRPVDQEDVACG
jgi:hypothetical protein